MMALSCSRVLKQLAASFASRSVGVVPPRHLAAVTTPRRGFISAAKAFMSDVSDFCDSYSPMTIGRELLDSTPHTFWWEACLGDNKLIEYKGLKFNIDIPGNEKTTYTDDGELLVSVYFGLDDFAKNQKIIEDDPLSDTCEWHTCLDKKGTELTIEGFTKKDNILANYSAKVNLPKPTLEEGNYNNIYWRPSKMDTKDGSLMVYLCKVKEEK